MGTSSEPNLKVEDIIDLGMARKTNVNSSSVAPDVNEENLSTEVTAEPQKKRQRPKDDKKVPADRKMPKRAAACTDFRNKPIRLSGKDLVVETKKEIIAEDEVSALHMTSGQEDSRPNRRLTDFVLHDSVGKAQPVEMLEVVDIFISGVIAPLEENVGKEKAKGIKCEGFGRVESWAISGYEEGAPVIWVSTDAADYNCGKPANNYKKLYSLFFEKANICIEVYKKLSRTCGGNPTLTIDELFAGVVRSMGVSKNFPHQMSIKDFVVSQGEFVYNQLIGLDETSKHSDEVFRDLPVLVALREECTKHKGIEQANLITSGKKVINKTLKIGDGEKTNQSTCSAEEDEDMKLARLLQEEEDWQSKPKRGRHAASVSNKFYITINEDEIVNDYPEPAYYKSSYEETDELIIFDHETNDPIDLPRSMLHNWSLYNSDSRLISLELLPMKPCADADVILFGSGLMMDDDGSGFDIHADTNQSSSVSAGIQSTDGMPIYLSAIKEWIIEFGAAMICISIRTDLAWYRLGKPSKQYAPWYNPVLKIARLTVAIITLLKEQSRVSKLSFGDLVKKVAEFDLSHPAYISSNLAAVERFIVVHGQIVLQQLSVYPDPNVKKCAFVTALRQKMEERHHTKWLVKKNAKLKKEVNLNPRAAMAPAVSKRKAMPATTTRLINGIWAEFYSNYSPDDLKAENSTTVKEDDEIDDEQEENGEEESEEGEEEEVEVDEKTQQPQLAAKSKNLQCKGQDLKWDGESVEKTFAGEAIYAKAILHGDSIAVGDTVLLETGDSPSMYFVEYMFENLDSRKMIHGRFMQRGYKTVLGNAAKEREVFLTNDCLDFEMDDVKQTVVVEMQSAPWGYQHRKANALKEKMDVEQHEERKRKGLPMEFFCKSFYVPDRGAFFSLPNATMGLGTGICYSCTTKESKRHKEMFELNLPGFSLNGIDYNIHDFVYLSPSRFAEAGRELGTFKSGRNVGLIAYVVAQLLEIDVPRGSKLACPQSTKVKVRRFFRPEDVSAEKAYSSDVREVYYSDHTLMVPVEEIEGKCDVRKKRDLPLLNGPSIVEHVFFCEHLYDPDNGAVKQLPVHKFNPSKEKVVKHVVNRKKGKCKEGESDINIEEKEKDLPCKNQLATLDIFAGCGGLSEGLQKAGVSVTKWAIEYEEPAGEAFKLNHPEAFVFIHNCNVILRAIMESSGDGDDCISTTEAAELTAKLDENMINNLPKPGEVEFINGGPPCQGFSGMNRFNQSTWSKVQCEMILSFLSFADYFRPRFFLLENVRNFVSFNKGQTFRLAVASLLAMGYQVRFGILEAGAFGVAQSRKRAFIWAAAPDENLPEWPEPMHVFASPELKVSLPDNSYYAAARSTSNGAPFRSITVRDTIGDLPPVANGASKPTIEYGSEPVSWYQKNIRANMMVLNDHVSKEMNELNLTRCQKIPKCPGSDWRDLPEEKVRLSTGQVVDLIPWCLPNTAKRHNQWKGLFGRLDWEGNFPTSITDPQPMGKVGMCFHPDQDRIITVRECARSQGFVDSYKFAGNILHKHRQIGNAVPPPLAYALGRKLKEAVETKGSN